MQNIISNIEMLPNELLVGIFEYLSPYDLYKTFFNLNLRLNIIITSLQNLHFILHEDWDNKQRIIPFFASQISTLIVQHDEFIDFSSYSNIRSLKLSMPTENQCNSIQPIYLPHLEYLYISNFFFTDHSKQLCRSIFSSDFSHLRICQIDRMTLDDCYSYFSSSLHQLIISPCTWKSNLYKQILRACPNLISLRIIRLQNLSFQLTFNSIHSHTSLRCLNIHFCSLGNDWYEQIDWLLSIVPNLTDFTLLIRKNNLNLEFPLDLFARLLIQHVPNLINLNVKIPLNRFLSKEFNLIKQLHPLFIHVDFHGYINRNLNNYLIISSRK